MLMFMLMLMSKCEPALNLVYSVACLLFLSLSDYLSRELPVILKVVSNPVNLLKK